MGYTLEEKYQIVVWHHNGKSENEIKTLFADMFANRPIPTRTAIHKIMHNLLTCGCLFPKEHHNFKGTNRDKRRPRSREEQEHIECRDTLICACVENDPSLTSTQLAEQFGISINMVLKILYRNGYRRASTLPYVAVPQLETITVSNSRKRKIKKKAKAVDTSKDDHLSSENST